MNKFIQGIADLTNAIAMTAEGANELMQSEINRVSEIKDPVERKKMFEEFKSSGIIEKSQELTQNLEAIKKRAAQA